MSKITDLVLQIEDELLNVDYTSSYAGIAKKVGVTTKLVESVDELLNSTELHSEEK